MTDGSRKARFNRRICARKGHLPKASIDTGLVWCDRCGTPLARYRMKEKK